MPKTNHRLKPVFLFLKKSRISAFFYSPFLPKKIGQFISTIIFTTTIATPATAYKDFKCGCGQESDLYNRPTCYAAPDYMTEYCVVSKTSSSFTYRMPDNYGGLSACAICHCYGDAGEWQNGNNGAIFRQVYSATSTSTLECTATYRTEVACKSGYYDPREPDFMVYECYECPWLEDKYHTMLHGWTEYANTNTDITDCYIRKEDTATGVWFEDDTGQYAITDDCYYSL